MRLPNGEDKIQQCANYVKNMGGCGSWSSKRSIGILFLFCLLQR